MTDDEKEVGEGLIRENADMRKYIRALEENNEELTKKILHLESRLACELKFKTDAP